MTSSSLTNTAQDLELVSALISMSTSHRNPHPSSNQGKVTFKNVESPHSPTRIDAEYPTPPYQPSQSSPPRRPWREQLLVPTHPHFAGSHYYAHSIPTHTFQVHPAMPPFSAIHIQGQHPHIIARPQASPITRYTPEQRKAAVLRFKAKKMRRKKQSSVIRYQVRKRLADTRPRFRGRFFKAKAVEKKSVGEDQTTVRGSGQQ